MTSSRDRIPPAARPDWAYFLDVDGTLVEFAQTPQEVEFDGTLMRLLTGLHQASGAAVALVSGRAVRDLDRLTGFVRMPLAGLHGLERRDSSGRHWAYASTLPIAEALKEALGPILKRCPAVLLEDKGMTLAVHFRRAPALAAVVREQLVRCIAELGGDGLELLSGKCVIEVKPSGYNKGTAVMQFLTEMPFRGRRAVFVGDDLNDESGFAQVNRLDGVTIKVGAGKSCAQYRLRDVAAVRQWLAGALA